MYLWSIFGTCAVCLLHSLAIHNGDIFFRGNKWCCDHVLAWWLYVYEDNYKRFLFSSQKHGREIASEIKKRFFPAPTLQFRRGIYAYKFCCFAHFFLCMISLHDILSPILSVVLKREIDLVDFYFLKKIMLRRRSLCFQRKVSLTNG